MPSNREGACALSLQKSPLGLEQMHLFTAEVSETTSSEIWRRGSQSLYGGDRKGKARSKGLLKRVYWNDYLQSCVLGKGN